MLGARKRYSGAPKLDVIAPQNGSVKREQLHGWWMAIASNRFSNRFHPPPLFYLYLHRSSILCHLSLSLYFIYHPRVYMNRRNSNAKSTFQFFFFSSVMKRVKVSRETLDALLPFLVVQERNENSILGKGKIIERSCCVEQDESFRKHRYSVFTVPGLNKSGGIVRALHRDYYYYLRLTSVQFSSVNIIKGMKRTGARGACWWWPAKKLAQRICVKLASRPNWKREIGRDRRFQSCLRSLSLSFAWLYSILRVLIPRGRELENTDNHERNEAYELKREILSLKFIKMFPVFEIGLNMWQFFFPLFFYFVSFIYL